MIAPTRFADVQTFLDEAVGGRSLSAHGAFWRNIDRNAFVKLSLFGATLVLRRADGSFDADGSALIQSLEGRAPFDETNYSRMPSGGLRPMHPDRIKLIRDWITNGCPT